MRYASCIKGPVELGIVVKALQYRNSQAVFLKQVVVFSDIDNCGSNPNLVENILCLFAKVAEPGAVEFGIYLGSQFSTSNGMYLSQIVSTLTGQPHIDILHVIVCIDRFQKSYDLFALGIVQCYRIFWQVT